MCDNSGPLYILLQVKLVVTANLSYVEEWCSARTSTAHSKTWQPFQLSSITSMNLPKKYRPRQIAKVAKPFDDRGPLVYTHQDLHMQNIILGDDGQLWIIDWDLAGFYPIFFEYIGIRIMEKVLPPSFNRWIPLITGQWDGRGQYDFVCRVGWAMMMKGVQL